ncbi:MAG: phosphoribosylanthranilate isomerase [Chitinophagales bacterium]
MKLKICGMRNAKNIADVLALQPDYMGFIFYAKSKRFVGEDFDAAITAVISASTQKVGVFVNSDFDYITSKVDKYGLQCVQLHGNESAELCQELKGKGIEVVKVFSVGEDFDFEKLKAYENHCDYFLFDTKGKDPGGNGVTFNWQVLENYPSSKPFFLSGGIGVEHLPLLQKWQHPQLYAIDVNSRFEVKPAEKNVEKLRKLVDGIYSKQ